MRIRFKVIAVLLLAACCIANSSAHGQRNVSEHLLQHGIQLTPDKQVPLVPPSLEESQSAELRQQTLNELAGNQGWERFSRDSVVAPVKIDLAYILNDAGDRIGHDIHTAFVAYAPLANLRDEALIREIFGRAAAQDGKKSDADDQAERTDAGARDVPDEELVKLGIEIPESAEHIQGERYAFIELPLLNRVTVTGVIRVEKHEGPGWLRMYWQLDPRFAKSEKYANTWTKIERDEVGRPVETEPQPYSGLGGFLSITEIDSTRNQLLVESRMIMHEPVDWFAGSNALRSKLPPVLQENARSFRRRVSK